MTHEPKREVSANARLLELWSAKSKCPHNPEGWLGSPYAKDCFSCQEALVLAAEASALERGVRLGVEAVKPALLKALSKLRFHNYATIDPLGKPWLTQEVREVIEQVIRALDPAQVIRERNGNDAA